MSAFFAEYSYLIVSLGVGGAAALFLLSNKPKRNDYIAFSVILSGLLALWVIAHPRQTPLMEDARKVRAMIGIGTPVLLEFQSPYCISCAQFAPQVDALESTLRSRVGIGAPIYIIRLNIQQTAGMELAGLYHVNYTPTFIFFDVTGQELWRSVDSLDAQKVRDSVK